MEKDNEEYEDEEEVKSGKTFGDPICCVDKW